MVSVFHRELLSYFNSSNSVGQMYIRALETLDSYTICNFFLDNHADEDAQLNFISRSAETLMKTKKKCTCLKQIQNTSYCYIELN